MPEKPQIYRTFREMVNSGNFKETEGEKENPKKSKKQELKKALENPNRRYSAINVTTNGKIYGQPVSHDRLDDTLVTLNDEQKSKYVKETYQTEEYDRPARTQAYANFLKKKLERKKKNSFINKIKPQVENTSRLLEYKHPAEENSGILQASTMPEKKTHLDISPHSDKKVRGLLNTDSIDELKFEEVKTGEESSPAEESEVIPQAGNMQTIERTPLTEEEQKLQSAVYRKFAYWDNKLSAISHIKSVEEKNKERRQSFRKSPYKWMIVATTNSINNLKAELEVTTEEVTRKKIEKDLEERNKDLENLNQALEKRIPLKLERNFNDKEIIFQNGQSLNIDESFEEINKYLGKQNRDYKIIGLVQRGDDRYLALRTDQGKEIEIHMNVVEKTFKIKGIDHNQEKEERFAKIHEGSIIRVRIGGPREPTTVYKIIKMKENGSVVFENLTLKRKEPNMSFESMKKFLFGPKVEFILEEEKRGAATMMPTENRKSATDTPEIDTNIEIQNRMNEVLRVESDLGFELNTPALLERYIQGISKEDAKVLFDEYKKLRSKEPATFPDVVEPVKTEGLEGKYEEVINALLKEKQEIEKLKQKQTELILEIENEKEAAETDHTTNEQEESVNIDELVNEPEKNKGDYAKLLEIVRHHIKNHIESVEAKTAEFLDGYKNVVTKMSVIESYRNYAKTEINESTLGETGSGPMYQCVVPHPRFGYEIPLEYPTKEELLEHADEMYDEALRFVGVSK